MSEKDDSNQSVLRELLELLRDLEPNNLVEIFACLENGEFNLEQVSDLKN